MTTYTNVFGGQNIYPSDLSYRAVTLSADVTLDWALETAPTTNVVADIMDVTATSAGFTIRMPDATEASNGQSVLFNNTGSNSFIVADNSGNVICTINSGQTFQVYLTSNATVNGTWRSFQFGASTAAASAAALAGYGIKAIAATLNQSSPVTSISTTYTAGAADRASTIVWTSGVGTLNLTAAATLGNDWFVMVRNAGTGGLTIDPNGAELINGASTLTLAPGDSAIVVSSGTQFYTIGFGRSSAYAFTLLSINIAGSGNYTLSTGELNYTAYIFTGALTGNREIIVPSSVQQYWVTNDTTGSFTLGIRTSTQSSPGVLLAQGSRAIFYCDGTNVVDADTNTISLPVSIVQGGTGATTASGARTALGATSVGDAVFIAADAAAAQIALDLDPIKGGTY
jgi:hypothetical protein